MFLLIYKCRIAVSMRGKWFWKAWHCKLSLSDRLSAPADQKMPQSMMSDRQANSLGGQTLLPHFQTLGMPGIMWLWKGIWVHILVGGSQSFRDCPWRSKTQMMEVVDEILTNSVRLTGRIIWMKMSCFVNIMYCQSTAAILSDHMSGIQFA